MFRFALRMNPTVLDKRVQESISRADQAVEQRKELLREERRRFLDAERKSYGAHR